MRGSVFGRRQHLTGGLGQSFLVGRIQLVGAAHALNVLSQVGRRLFADNHALQAFVFALESQRVALDRGLIHLVRQFNGDGNLRIPAGLKAPQFRQAPALGHRPLQATAGFGDVAQKRSMSSRFDLPDAFGPMTNTRSPKLTPTALKLRQFLRARRVMSLQMPGASPMNRDCSIWRRANRPMWRRCGWTSSVRWPAVCSASVCTRPS